MTPDISYYNDVYKSEYSKLITSNWSFKDETIKYLNLDLLVLYEILVKANKQVFMDYDLNMVDSLTIYNLAMKLYMTKYYNNNIPSINKPSLYNDVKLAYYGGITEVYKPYGENLYYYDVNSLYPYAALNSMPGTNCIYMDTINNSIENIDNFFGFYYCTIKTNNSYLGLLPVRSKQGIIMPNGEWSGWYFSEQLKFASLNGYEIFVHKGYNFDKQNNVFDSYVNNLYEIKSTTSNPIEKAISKSLLNNLLGRFGLNIHTSKTDLVDMDNYNEIVQTKSVKSIKTIGDKILINYTNYVSKAICDELNVDYKNAVIQNIKNNHEKETTFRDVSLIIASAVTSYARIHISKIKLNSDVIKSHNLDIVKLSNVHKDRESTSIDGTSIVMSAAVTAYARIHMSKLKLDIVSKNGNIYYTDTDSIVCDIKLDNNIVDPNLLGKLKLEHIVRVGIFISGKTYCLILLNLILP